MYCEPIFILNHTYVCMLQKIKDSVLLCMLGQGKEGTVCKGKSVSAICRRANLSPVTVSFQGI